MSIWLNWPLMLAGRFVFAFTAGITTSATPKMIEETVPAHLIERGFGQSTNTFICFGFFLALLAGSGTPTSEEELAKTDYWKVFYLIQVPFLLIALPMMLFYHKYDSLLFHVKRNDKDIA